MKRCQIDLDFLSELDLFGKEPEFFYKGKSQKTSYFGRILSILYVILYVAFFVYKLVRMIRKLDIDFYETYAFTGTPSISLNSKNFYAGFSIGGIMDKRLYFPALQYWVETRTDGIKNDPIIKNIDLEVCQLEKFGKDHQSLLKDKPLQNFYCIKNVEEDLIGYGSLDTFSYYYIMIFPCIGHHPDGTECYPLENVTKFFTQTFLEFTVQDIELTPKDYDNPSEPLTKDITTPVFHQLYQSIFGYFQIVNLETNLDVFGFEPVTSYKYDKFLKYDQSWIIASPSPHTYGLQAGVPICDVMIQLAAKVLTIKRNNTLLIDVLGDVGGLMEFIWSLFNIISMFITDLLYDIDIINNLFSFDLGKKKVLLKCKKKGENSNLNEEGVNIYDPNFYTNKIINVINDKNEKNNDSIKNEKKNDSIKNEENPNEKTKDIFIKRKKKRGSSKFYSTGISNNKKIKNENETSEITEIKKFNKKQTYNKINEPNSGTALSNSRIISEEKKQKTENDNAETNKNENIKDTIHINNFFVVFAFCCIRKRKNDNSYLLEEGLNILKERLDILNIFNKIYYDEKIQESFKNKSSEIEMSDYCKQKLQ